MNTFEIKRNFANEVSRLSMERGASLVDSLRLLTDQHKGVISKVALIDTEEASRIRSSAKHTVMIALSTLHNSRFETIKSIRLFEHMYGPGGIFNDPEGFAWQGTTSMHTSYLAACFYMVMNHPQLSMSSREPCFRCVSTISFVNDSRLEKFVKELEKIDHCYPGRSNIESIRDVVKSAHKSPLFSPDDVKCCLSSGGLSRLVELNVDIKGFLSASLDSMSRFDMSANTYKKLHGFCTEINDYLRQEGLISPIAYNVNAGKLLGITLTLSEMPENRGQPIWKDIVENTESIVEYPLTAAQAIQCSKLTRKMDPQVRLLFQASSYPVEEIREAISRISVEHRFQMIKRLELEANFSKNDLNSIHGQILEDGLGL